MQAKQGQGLAEQQLEDPKSEQAGPSNGEVAADPQAEGDALAQVASLAAVTATPAPMLVDSQEPLTGLSSGTTVGRLVTDVAVVLYACRQPWQRSASPASLPFIALAAVQSRGFSFICPLCGEQTLYPHVGLLHIAEMACSTSETYFSGPSQASDPLLEKETPASSCPSGLPTDSNLPTNVGMRIRRRRANAGEPTVTKVSSNSGTTISYHLCSVEIFSWS